MKKVFFLAFTCVLISSGLHAQTTQGSMTLGGNFGYSSSKSEGFYGVYTSSSFQVSPKAGYFIMDNLEVGLGFGISTGKSGLDGFDPTKTNSFSVGPYARYYKFTSNDRFAFTGALGFSFGSGKSSTGNSENKTGSMGISIAPGFVYFLTERWGLDFQLNGIGFSSYDPNKDVDNNNQKEFTFNISSLSPTLGFRYYISK